MGDGELALGVRGLVCGLSARRKAVEGVEQNLVLRDLYSPRLPRIIVWRKRARTVSVKYYINALSDGLSTIVHVLSGILSTFIVNEYVTVRL